MKIRKRETIRTPDGRTITRITCDEPWFYRSEKVRKEIHSLAALPSRPLNESLDIPKITKEEFKRFVPGRWLCFRAAKKRITLQLDQDVLEWLPQSKKSRDWFVNRILRYKMCLAYKDRLEYANECREKAKRAAKRKAANRKSRRA